MFGSAKVPSRILPQSFARWTCRCFAVMSNVTSSSLNSCDFKMGRVLSSLQKFRCTYNFTIRLPLTGESISRAPIFGDVLRSGIAMTVKDLINAKTFVNGNLVMDDTPTTSDVYHDMELLVPSTKDMCIEGELNAVSSSLSNVVGILFFSSSICSYAFLNSKEPISQAISDIKDNILTSLQSRLDIVLDEGEGDCQPGDDGKELSTDSMDDKFAYRAEIRSPRISVSLSFPRRVFIPWLAGTFICDYLQPSESLEIVKDHCAQMMSLEVFPVVSDILGSKGESAAVVAKCFWDVVVPFRCPSTSTSYKWAHTSSSNFSTAAAILVLMFAVLAGYLFFCGAS